MQPTNEKSYRFYRAFDEKIEQHTVTFNTDPSWTELSSTIKQLFNATISSNNQFIFKPLNGPKVLLYNQRTLDSMLQSLDSDAPRVITIKRMRMPRNRYSAQARLQAPQSTKTVSSPTSNSSNVADLLELIKLTKLRYYEDTSLKFISNPMKSNITNDLQAFLANPKGYPVQTSRRIIILPQLIFEPSDKKLIDWANKVGISQQIGITNPDDTSQFTTEIMTKLRMIYIESINNWIGKSRDQQNATRSSQARPATKPTRSSRHQMIRQSPPIPIVAIPQNRRPTIEPTDAQLISWAKQHGLSQRLGITNPDDASEYTPEIVARIREIYAKSLQESLVKNRLN